MASVSAALLWSTPALLLLTAVAAAAPPADIKAYCAGKWADYTMQVYCIEREEQAQRRLAAGVSDQQIWARCYYKWDAWTMVAYCIDQEDKAKARILGTAPPQMPASPPTPQRPTTATPTPAPPAVSTHDVDVEGVRACLALKEALDTYLASGYLPGLKGRLFNVASQGARSNDPYLRNAMSRLSSSSTSDELITWMRVTTDVCVNRTAQGPSTTIYAPAAPTPSVETPRPAAKPLTHEEVDRQTKRATEQSGAKKCETKVYGGGAAVTVCD
jgi:hypothetical protein